MPDLTEVLAVVRSRIEQHSDKAIGEQNTKSVLITPVLRALGWDMEDLDEVRLEYKRQSMDNPVDYALFVQRSARLFVEAKALGGNIADPKWAGQIMGYAVVAGVEWVCLTDGDSWHIYNSHVVVPVDQKLFRKVRLSEDGAAASETLSLLSKERMRENLIDTLWKAHFVDRQIKTALERSFGPEPDASLVRLLRKHAPDLAPSEIRSGLARAQIRFDFPGPPIEASGPGPDRPKRPSKPRNSTDDPTSEGKRRGEGTPWRHVTLTDLIAESLIRPPLELSKLYRGHQLSARIEADGQVSFGGSATNRSRPRRASGGSQWLGPSPIASIRRQTGGPSGSSATATDSSASWTSYADGCMSWPRKVARLDEWTAGSLSVRRCH